MMEGRNEMIAYRLARAHEAITEAKFLIQHQHLNTAVNRLYYACFYSVSALLLSKELVVKRHSAAIQLFGLHFVGTGIVSRDAGRFYSHMLELRQESDYEYFVEFDIGEVDDLVPKAEALIAEIIVLLNNQGFHSQQL